MGCIGCFNANVTTHCCGILCHLPPTGLAPTPSLRPPRQQQPRRGARTKARLCERNDRRSERGALFSGDSFPRDKRRLRPCTTSAQGMAARSEVFRRSGVFMDGVERAEVAWAWVRAQCKRWTMRGCAISRRRLQRECNDWAPKSGTRGLPGRRGRVKKPRVASNDRSFVLSNSTVAGSWRRGALYACIFR